MLKAMEADGGIHLSSLKVDGGASQNNLLMQMQADISGAPVHRPACVETTAMGAAYLAGLAVGYWDSKEKLSENMEIDCVFEPQISEEEREKKSIRMETGSPLFIRMGKRRIRELIFSPVFPLVKKYDNIGWTN